ncbi:MAG: hypothetical protein H6822_18610 [Planctomycetaceae bacterium]|nr:hypothetical protein [Planctomycetales bacterium]MCB9924200.1 hypothetical protein [Planctomycetaceae bacterium]
MNIDIFGKTLRNLAIFNEARKIGFEYLLNPETGELHRTTSDFIGSHNLHVADLGNFIGLVNVGLLQLHRFPDGTQIPIYDLDTGAILGTYDLNKCQHCKWW